MAASSRGSKSLLNWHSICLADKQIQPEASSFDSFVSQVACSARSTRLASRQRGRKLPILTHTHTDSRTVGQTSDLPDFRPTITRDSVGFATLVLSADFRPIGHLEQHCKPKPKYDFNRTPTRTPTRIRMAFVVSVSQFDVIEMARLWLKWMLALRSYVVPLA